MFNAEKINRTFTLSSDNQAYVFGIFSLKEYHFDEGISFVTDSNTREIDYIIDEFSLTDESSLINESKNPINTCVGLYCFTRIWNICDKGDEPMHELLYLGIARGKKGVSGRLNSNHEKLEKLKKNKCSFVGLHICNNTNEIKDIESKLLSNYYFLLNVQENETKGDKQIIVMEDSEGISSLR